MLKSAISDLKKLVSNRIDPGSAVIGFLYTVLFVVWEILIFEFYTIQYLISLRVNYGFRQTAIVVLLIFFSLILFFLYIYATLISPPVIRGALIAVFAAVVFFQYGYVNALGRFANGIDLEVALFITNFEQKTGAVMANLNWLAAIPCAALILIGILSRPVNVFGRRFLFVLSPVLLIGLFAAAPLVKNPDLTIYPLISATSFVNELTRIPPVWFVEYGDRRERLERPADLPERPANNIVFVVDESVSSAHLSIYGYRRETTPFLDRLDREKKIKKLPAAVSGTYCSTGSAYLLLTGLTVKDLPDGYHRQVKSRPTIYQYARMMNYRVHFFDGQMDHFWNSPYLDRRFVDEWRGKSFFAALAGNDYDIDLAIARRVREIVASSKGNFIWVWKRGVHTPFDANYPENEEVWKPAAENLRIRKNTPEELINGYDNGLRYNLDAFFEILAPVFGNTSKNVLIYTSDHGQNVLITSAPGLTIQQKYSLRVRVPLLLMGDLGGRINPDFRATHANIFPTLLDLMGVPGAARKYGYDASLLEREPPASDKQRYFWGCDLRKYERFVFDESLAGRQAIPGGRASGGL